MARDPYRYFRIEARELLDGLLQGVLALERAAGDSDGGADGDDGTQGRPMVDGLLRMAHTLKGAARVVRQEAIAQAVHSMEELLLALREGAPGDGGEAGAAARRRPEHIGALLKLLDAAREGLESLGAAGQDAGPVGAGAAATAAATLSAGAGEAPAARQATSAGEPATAREAVRVELSEIELLLADTAVASQQVTGLRRLGPMMEQARRAAAALCEQLVRIGATPDPTAETDARRTTDHRDASRLASDHRDASRLTGDPAAPDPTGPVARARLLAEELRDTLGRLERRLLGGVEQAERELLQVRDRQGRLRLLPASVHFALLERAARDAALALGKRVAFFASGGEVDLDGHVLSVVAEALVQLVRNAVAHGIEDEAQRVALGKPPVGQVRLRVERRGGRAAFSCSDDGRGIDYAAVQHRAVALGRLTPIEAAQLGPAEHGRLDQLLLHGGISTADSANQVAGRGVGLDVVRAVAARIGGEVSLRSEPGRGATVELVVPVSISSLQVLPVEAGGSLVALPLSSVKQSLRIGREQIVQQGGGEALLHMDAYLPFLSMRSLLGLATPAQTGTRADPARGGDDRRLSCVVLSDGESRAVLGVDRLHGITEVVMRPLPALLGRQPGVLGAAFDADGDPQLILDPRYVLSAARSAERTPERTPKLGSRAADAAPAGPRARLPVLIIDDSLTTRTLEQSILSAAGYHVDLATSAEEALLLAGSRRYGLFIVDVEMPGMSGFDFVERTRQDPALRDIPSILVTSLGSPADRRRGAVVGARAYLVKSEFDENRLLQTIHDVIG